MVGCGLQDARGAQEEQAAEVVRNDVGGTCRGLAVLDRSPPSQLAEEEWWEWTPGACVDGGTNFENPKRECS
jgi:hypothetical protein